VVGAQGRREVTEDALADLSGVERGQDGATQGQVGEGGTGSVQLEVVQGSPAVPDGGTHAAGLGELHEHVPVE
jgi:hypothetical protein